MILKKTLAILLIATGVILGSLFAAHIPPNWIEFGFSVLVLVAGLVFLRILTKKELASLERESGVFHAPDKILKEAEMKLDAVFQFTQKNGITDSEIEELDSIQKIYFLEFASRKETLIEKYGIKKYADFMIPFSMAERFLNRSISSGIDHYYDEAFHSLKSVFPHLNETLHKLEER